MLNAGRSVAVIGAGYGTNRNPRMIDYLARNAGEMFAIDEAPERSWLGFRPSFPDSLPAIGRPRESSRIIYATGHHHLGLTRSGITGWSVNWRAAKHPATISPR